MALSDIVSVSITATTKTPTQTGFGTPCVLAYHTVFPELVRRYSSVADMISDGFTASDDAVRAVTAILSQNPSVSEVVVGRTTSDTVRTVKVTPKQTYNSTAYTLYLNGSAATYTSDTSATVAEICTGLKDALDALSENVTVTDNTTDIDIAADSVADQFSLYAGDWSLLGIEDNTTDGGIVADLTAIRAVDDDFYFIYPTNQGSAVIAALAAHVETLTKLLIVDSPDEDIWESGSSDIMSTLKTAGYARTALVAHYKANYQCPAAAWEGKGGPKAPGSITWKFKTLAGVDYTEPTTTERNYALGKYANIYTRTAGISMMEEGLTAAGEYIDVTRGVDFITARLQEYVFGALANADKVPFTNVGIGVIEAQVWAVLRLAVANDILVDNDNLTVTVPDVSDVPTADKANRYLTGVTFKGDLAGAIHKVQITGTVSA